MFLTIVNFGKKVAQKNLGPTNFFKRQQIFRLAANYYGRKRNCYSIAIKYVHRALVYATRGRRQKKINERELWIERLRAGCDELDTRYSTFIFGLTKSNILINKKNLADLAIWEPRTFKSLTQVAAMKEYSDPMADNVIPLKPPKGVITKGML